MVQLKVYDGSNQYWLDLYDTEPIKLNLSIEDITDSQARSVFSRTFRVPATRDNNKFFKHAFLVEGIDYDVTVKKPAEILVDGAEFKTGHIRLQKIYVNGERDNIDYEVVFFGETRDFASQLGDKKLKDLDLSEYDHDLSYANVTLSWQAFPEGSGTDGLFNGDILYPLIDFGTNEDESRVAYTGNTSDRGFNHQQNYIEANRFKPMIRAKALWDKIFDESGFTYTSTIANSPDFIELYVSAFGNTPGVYDIDGSANVLNVDLTQTYYISGTETIKWDDQILDPSNNYNPSTGIYTVPATGNYEIRVIVEGNTLGEAGGGSVSSRLMNGAQPLSIEFTTIPANTSRRWYHVHTFSITDPALSLGDQLYVEVSENGDVDRTQINPVPSSFVISQAAGQVGMAAQLDADYKQIDYIRDFLTMFRLVMAPDRSNPKNFIIETWDDYIAKGDIYDWTDKVDRTKDIAIEPIFFGQTDEIEFRKAEDADYLNALNQSRFKETFGTLKFDSGNELLKGKREIETTMAPTPVTQITGAGDSNFILPILNSREITEDNLLKEEPIKPITRLLFYNGLFTQTKPTQWPSNENEWYFRNEATGTTIGQDKFPMVSYWADFDEVTGPQEGALNLNWQIEPGYANPYGTFNYEAGISLYESFWGNYINDLYNKFARKVTMYIVLDNVDLQQFSFDDVIFIDGVYYRPEKIVDVPIGSKSPVKVELVKLLNYIPEYVVLNRDWEDIDTNWDDILVDWDDVIPVDPPSPDPVLRIYALQSCVNPGDYVYAYYQSVDALAPGSSVNVSGSTHVGICYEVIDETTQPPSTAVIAVYPDCLSCSE